MSEAAMTAWAVRAGAAITALGAGAMFATGLWFVAQDAGTQGELDGLGTFVGLSAVAIGLVPLAVAGIALRLLRHEPRTPALVLAVFGALVALLGWVATGPFGVAVAAPMVLGGLLVGGIGFGAALASSR